MMTDPKVKELLTSPIEILYVDPISSSTRKSGWILTIASFASICVLVFKFKPTQILGLTIPQPSDSRAFEMLVTTIVFGLTIPYIIRIIAETMREKESDHFLANKIAERTNAWLVKTAGKLAVSANISDPSEYAHEHPDAECYVQVVAHQASVEIQDDKSMQRILKAKPAIFVRKFRFFTTLGVPLLVAMLALWIGRVPLKEAVILIAEKL